MSELKAYNATIHPKMKNACDGAVEVYHKSEADKVIAGLQEKLKEQTSIAEEMRKEFRTYHTSYAEAVKELYEKNKELRHHKYKRCLAMARWCRSRACFYDTIREDRPYWGVKSDRAYKWYKWWFKTAFQFKEAK